MREARKEVEMPTALKQQQRFRREPPRAALWADISEREHLLNRLDEIIMDRLVMPIMELEAALDFYAWGPSPKGEPEPRAGEEYAKAMAKDGGAIGRAAESD